MCNDILTYIHKYFVLRYSLKYFFEAELNFEKVMCLKKIKLLATVFLYIAVIKKPDMHHINNVGGKKKVELPKAKWCLFFMWAYLK